MPLGYCQLGCHNKNLKAKVVETNKQKKTDWVNIFLFIVLIVVVILFVVT
jgi:hypothetical protein